MDKFVEITHQYIERGVTKENIEYAIDSVKSLNKRDHIIEGLMEDYRGLSLENANDLVDDLYKINGKEFRKENTSGFLVGILFLIVGLACSYYLFSFYTNGGVLVRPILVWIGAICGTFVGVVYLIMSIFGKHREDVASNFLNED
jgi:hypothetical protein